MLKSRVIPCLLLKDAGLVKTTRFAKPQYVGDPINAIRIFNDKEVDELVLLDIDATRSGRGPSYSTIEEVASECFMPLAYGGGVRSVEEARRILRLGVEKIIFNAAAWYDPKTLARAAAEFGSQAVVASIDVRRKMFGRYEVYVDNGTKRDGQSPAEYAANGVDRCGRNPAFGNRSGWCDEGIRREPDCQRHVGRRHSRHRFGRRRNAGRLSRSDRARRCGCRGGRSDVRLPRTPPSGAHHLSISSRTRADSRVKRLRRDKGRVALLVAALAVLGGVFLHWVGIDALEGRNTFEFFADSVTYHAAAQGDLLGVEGVNDLIGVTGNYLGPLLLLRIAGENYYVILIINAVLLYGSLVSISKSVRCDSLRLAIVLLVNPLTISSLLSVNKEILSLVFVALLLRAYSSRSLRSWAAVALLSLLVRWQLTAFLIVFSLFASPANPFRRDRLKTIVLLLVGLSVLYLQLSAVFEPIRSTFELSASEYEGSGFYEWLQGWQERGAYAIVFPLKAMHLLFGLGLRFDRLFAPVNFYNDVWQLLHSTMTLVVFVALLTRKRFNLDNDLVYISVFYIAVFALSPIYSPRYFYPVYVLWAAALVTRLPRVSLLPATAARRRRDPGNLRTSALRPPGARP